MISFSGLVTKKITRNDQYLRTYSRFLEQSLALLNVRPGPVWVDATAGGGGHLREILRRSEGAGTVFGIDRDQQTLAQLDKSLNGSQYANLKLVHANYCDLQSVLAAQGISTVDGGIIADLGVSSMQLDDPARGFSFMNDGPLDMRMDKSVSKTAEDLINNLSEKDLADTIFNYSDERASRRIARAIIQARPLRTTGELVRVISPVVERYRRIHHCFEDLHPATRTFQAIRIAVNDNSLP